LWVISLQDFGQKTEPGFSPHHQQNQGAFLKERSLHDNLKLVKESIKLLRRKNAVVP
jgi:hypothetical protein